MATTDTTQRYKLVFFCPTEHLPAIKAAVFAAGAGRYPGPGGYTEVGFATPGQGQFRPGADSHPHTGSRGTLEQIEEMRFETLCVGAEVTKAAVAALKRTHPYEEVAYEVYKIEPF